MYLCANRQRRCRRAAGGGRGGYHCRLCGHTALYSAASEAHAGVVQALIDEGAAYRSCNRSPRPTCRGGAACRGVVLLREGEAANPCDTPRDNEGDPPRTSGGFTPLLYAVLAGDTTTVRVLLDNGADPNDASPDGVSAVMLALNKRHEDVALLLIDRGADPNYDRRDDVLDPFAHLADGQDPLAIEPRRTFT